MTSRGCPAPRAPGCACRVNADCVKVAFGCCDCALGGSSSRSPRRAPDTLEECAPPPDAACTCVDLCSGKQAACVDHQCVLQ